MKTILLVDDNRPLITAYGLALRDKGYHVLEANSGFTGLAMARKHLPDLIITDIDMPDGNGRALLHEIRQDPTLMMKQVVIMTGRPEVFKPRQGMEEGADDFLVKPVKIEALRTCVEARLRRASINRRMEDQLLAQLGSQMPSQLPHELFTPMSAILGLMEILKEDSPSFSPEVAEIHSDVYKSALRLNRTLKNYIQILDISERPSGRIEPISPGKTRTAIQGGLDQSLLTHSRHVDLQFLVEPCSLPICEDNLRHLVEELVDNAFKFSSPGTPVTVALKSPGILTVGDRGRGMSAEQINQIGAFRQFDRKKNEQQGLGLGLILVQKMVEACNARFELTSREGLGTEIALTFSTLPGP